MSKKKNETIKEKSKKHNFDKGQIFVKIMAGILAILMVAATAITLIYSLIG